ncbi:MAG: deoxyribose-phosphate aldolase [Treponema sp.]|jgi:deoxyribose-phosphate aldolase|nr:deoxyribose-phosphate aldolase [Treponema sp.]
MPLNGKQLARMIDSTHIATLAKKEELDEAILQAKEMHFFAVNGPACYFPYLVEQLEGSDVNPGFGCTRWSGADPTACKAYAAKWAVSLGAKEIDMVMNQSYLVSGLYKEAEEDIRHVKKAIGSHALKVIIECPLHDEERIRKAAEIIIDAGADCIKTCTGMEGPFAMRHIEIISSIAKGRVWIKAAGGIRDLPTVDRLIDLGVARLGINYRSAKYICEMANHR